MNKVVRNAISISCILFFIFVLMGFIVTPFTGDLKVFMASAHQSSYISDNLLEGAYKAWELKSVFSRMLMYAIYKLALIFVEFSSYQFEMCSKAIYAVLAIIIIATSIKTIFRKDIKDCFLHILFVSCAFFALHTACQMQVEMTASLLILLAFSLYYNAIQTNKKAVLKLFVSGILIGSVFYYKSVLILLSVTVVAAICICNINNSNSLSLKRMLLVVSGSVCILIVNLFLILIINPVEIEDMLNASAFQSTLFSSNITIFSIPSIIKIFAYYYISYIRYIPVLILATVAFLGNFFNNMKKKKYNLIFFHIIMWLMPAMFIILSNRYFVYHFTVFLFPSLIEIYYFVHKAKKYENVLVYLSGCVAVIIYCFFFSVASPNVKNSIMYDKQSYAETEAFKEKINFDVNEEMLYLDDGFGAYHLGNYSYLKYYFPLPLQRLDSESTLKCYTESQEAVLGYTGKYISVYEEWFFGNGKNELISEKILDEYEYVGNYARYSPSNVLLTNDSVTYFSLYERKK